MAEVAIELYYPADDASAAYGVYLAAQTMCELCEGLLASVGGRNDATLLSFPVG